MFLCCFEPEKRRLVFANAGHSPVIYRPTRGRARFLQADECPLGVRPDWRGADSGLRFAPGDLLVAATDGFSEAYDERTGELFGYRRLLDFAERTAGLSAADIAAALFQATDDFGGAAADDRTLVIVRGLAV
jgi:sigma-B regulation protein RsbU (phosphoserine phosphatase)